MDRRKTARSKTSRAGTERHARLTGLALCCFDAAPVQVVGRCSSSSKNRPRLTQLRVGRVGRGLSAVWAGRLRLTVLSASLAERLCAERWRPSVAAEGGDRRPHTHPRPPKRRKDCVLKLPVVGILPTRCCGRESVFTASVPSHTSIVWDAITVGTCPPSASACSGWAKGTGPSIASSRAHDEAHVTASSSRFWVTTTPFPMHMATSRST